MIMRIGRFEIELPNAPIGGQFGANVFQCARHC
jgi:hypothetical protein